MHDVRTAPTDYLGLKLRTHAILHDVPLYDVSVIDLPGGGVGRSIADIRALDSAAPRSFLVGALFEVRRLLGRVFRWDKVVADSHYSLSSVLTDGDRRESEVPPGTADGPFRVLYRFRHEQLSEIRNATVQGYVCLALASSGKDYRLYFAVYVLPVSWLTRPYLFVIEPFRRFLLYPAMLGRIRRAWAATYGS